MSINTEFEQKVKEAKAARLKSNNSQRLRSEIAINDALRRESAKTMETLVRALSDELGLDSERIERSIKTARKSKYGRVSELITKVASIYAWPLADNSQASEIPELQERVVETLASLGVNVDPDLLLDIKEAKGFNSFMDQATFEVVDGIEPEYDELEYYLMTFADCAQLPIIDYKMTPDLWVANEAKALKAIKQEKRLAEEALARHQEMAQLTKGVA
jgi:hypothetical protein